MKKNYILFSFLLFSVIGNAQFADIAPNTSSNQGNLISSNRTILTTEFLYDIGASIGAPGNAGIVFINNQFWVSAWASNNIHVLSNTGAFIETFQVTGLTGTRSMTTDGTNVYCGTAGNSIFVVDPTTRTLTSTIAISTTSGATARFCAYDASLNSGAGGFWIANFNTAIASVSMTGSQLSVIPATTHTLTGMYGAAVDGSGLLYVYHQSAPSNDIISSINLATGLPTGVVYDFFANDASQAGSSSSLAGGLFISTTVISGETVLVGVSQATPSNLLYGLNINTVLSAPSSTLAQFNLFPNPVKESLTINSKNNEINGVKIYNFLGQLMIDKKGTTFSEKIDISTLQKGNYIVSVESVNAAENFKIVKE